MLIFSIFSGTGESSKFIRLTIFNLTSQCYYLVFFQVLMRVLKLASLAGLLEPELARNVEAALVKPPLNPSASFTTMSGISDLYLRPQPGADFARFENGVF